MSAPVIRCPACWSAVPTDALAAMDDRCPRCLRPLNAGSKHQRAVAQTLGWADAAAASGDHAGALEWLSVVETVGQHLSSEYQRKRQSWRLALRAKRERTSVRSLDAATRAAINRQTSPHAGMIRMPSGVAYSSSAATTQ